MIYIKGRFFLADAYKSYEKMSVGEKEAYIPK